MAKGGITALVLGTMLVLAAYLAAQTTPPAGSKDKDGKDSQARRRQGRLARRRAPDRRPP